jgi:hypothetical protein
MFGFIEHYFTIAINYSAIANLHNSLGHTRFSSMFSQQNSPGLPVTKSSNHTLNLQRPTSKSSSITTSRGYVLPTTHSELNYAEPYILSARTTHRKHSSVLFCGADHVENTASYIVTCWYVFTEPFPRNGLHNPVVLLLRACITQQPLPLRHTVPASNKYATILLGLCDGRRVSTLEK